MEIEAIPGKENVDADCLSQATVAVIDRLPEGWTAMQQEHTQLQQLQETESSKFQERNELLFQIEDGQLRVVVPK